MSLWQKRNDSHQIVEGKRVLGIGSVVWGRGREGVFRQRGSDGGGGESWTEEGMSDRGLGGVHYTEPLDRGQLMN